MRFRFCYITQQKSTYVYIKNTTQDKPIAYYLQTHGGFIQSLTEWIHPFFDAKAKRN